VLEYVYGGIIVKRKLTVTIDEELVPKAKKHARSVGVSLSQLIEQALREISDVGAPSFSERWRGKLRTSNRRDERYRHLSEKYL
jgi:hypothetical protein